MLLTAKAYAEGGRALQIFCTLLLDKEHHHPDERVRKESGELVALLTPIVKAFITDNGHVATNACLQVFGGHGYIREWGMEQFARDNRINMIYEGTNAIQSLDLLGRKILGNNGATLKKFGKLVARLVEEEGVNEQMAEFINPIAALGDQLVKFTTEIGFKGSQNADEVGAAAGVQELVRDPVRRDDGVGIRVGGPDASQVVLRQEGHRLRDPRRAGGADSARVDRGDVHPRRRRDGRRPHAGFASSS